MNSTIRIPKAHDMDQHDPQTCRRCVAKAAANPDVARRHAAYAEWRAANRPVSAQDGQEAPSNQEGRNHAMTTKTALKTIPCERVGCPNDATFIESRVDARRDHRYMCDDHLSGGVFEPTSLDGSAMPLATFLAVSPPKHRSTTKKAAKAIVEASRSTLCGAFVCDRTEFLTMYQFADGTKQAYCTEHSGAAVMNGGRSEPKVVATDVDLNRLAELEALAEAAVAFATTWQHGIGHSCSAFHDDYQGRSADGLNSNWRTLRDRALAWRKNSQIE